jgi:hypothetical protein
MIRFHVDEDQSGTVAVIARERFSLDVTSSHELGMDRLSDATQLAFAASADRCIVTANRDDFAALTLDALAAELPHAGVLIVPRSMPGNQFMRLARALAYYATLYPDGLPPYHVDFLRDPPEGWEAPPHG